VKGPLPKAASDRRGHRRTAPIATIRPVDPPPPPPADLGPAGRQAWVTWWHHATWLASSDAMFVHLLASLLDRASALEARIALDGLIVEGSTGQRVAHPLLGVLASLNGLIVSVAGDCAFTPAGRRRLGIEVRPMPAPTALDRLVGRRDRQRIGSDPA